MTFRRGAPCSGVSSAERSVVTKGLKNRKDYPSKPENEKYQQFIGALFYIVNTRPDISASVTILSQYNKQPTAGDWTEVKRVGRYLKGSDGGMSRSSINSQVAARFHIC